MEGHPEYDKLRLERLGKLLDRYFIRDHNSRPLGLCVRFLGCSPRCAEAFLLAEFFLELRVKRGSSRARSSICTAGRNEVSQQPLAWHCRREKAR
jgi:hypothetical protein